MMSIFSKDVTRSSKRSGHRDEERPENWTLSGFGERGWGGAAEGNDVEEEGWLEESPNESSTTIFFPSLFSCFKTWFWNAWINWESVGRETFPEKSVFVCLP